MSAVGSTLTAGELRKALEGVDDGAAVFLSLDGEEWFIDSALGSDLTVTLTSQALLEEVAALAREANDV